MNIPGLQPSVVRALPTIFGRWEGAALPYMYADEKGHVTAGTGNEIDSPQAAIAFGTWHHGEGGPIASPDEVAAAWQAVKDAWPGVQSTASASLTDLRVDQASLDAAMDRTVAAFWSTLRGYFPNADKVPADAQLMLLSNAWPWGPAFVSSWDHYYNGLGTQFRNAFVRGDFKTASALMQQGNAHEMQINPGIIPRVQGQVVMLNNARKNKFHPATLYYPNTVGGIGALLGGLPWKSPLAMGAVGALAGGPVGALAGLVVGAVAGYVVPRTSVGAAVTGAESGSRSAIGRVAATAQYTALGAVSKASQAAGKVRSRL